MNQELTQAIASAQNIGATTGGLKRSQILTSDLGLLYKQQIPRSRVEVLQSRVGVLQSRVGVLQSRVEVLQSRVGVLQTLSHRNQVHRCGLRLRLTFKTVATHFYFLGKTYAVLHQNCCHSKKP